MKRLTLIVFVCLLCFLLISCNNSELTNTNQVISETASDTTTETEATAEETFVTCQYDGYTYGSYEVIYPLYKDGDKVNATYKVYNAKDGVYSPITVTDPCREMYILYADDKKIIFFAGNCPLNYTDDYYQDQEKEIFKVPMISAIITINLETEKIESLIDIGNVTNKDNLGSETYYQMTDDNTLYIKKSFFHLNQNRPTQTYKCDLRNNTYQFVEDMYSREDFKNRPLNTKVFINGAEGSEYDSLNDSIKELFKYGTNPRADSLVMINDTDYIYHTNGTNEDGYIISFHYVKDGVEKVIYPFKPNPDYVPK